MVHKNKLGEGLAPECPALHIEYKEFRRDSGGNTDLSTTVIKDDWWSSGVWDHTHGTQTRETRGRSGTRMSSSVCIEEHFNGESGGRRVIPACQTICQHKIPLIAPGLWIKEKSGSGMSIRGDSGGKGATPTCQTTVINGELWSPGFWNHTRYTKRNSRKGWRQNV